MSGVWHLHRLNGMLSSMSESPWLAWPPSVRKVDDLVSELACPGDCIGRFLYTPHYRHVECLGEPSTQTPGLRNGGEAK